MSEIEEARNEKIEVSLLVGFCLQSGLVRGEKIWSYPCWRRVEGLRKESGKMRERVVGVKT